MKRFLTLFFVSILILYSAVPAFAGDPYLAQDNLTAGGYPLTYHSWTWWSSAVNNGRPGQIPGPSSLKWNFDTGSDQTKWGFPIVSYINDAFGYWMVPGGINVSPPWMHTLWVADSSASQLRFNHTDDCIGVSCIKYLTYYADSVSHGAFMGTYRIHIINAIFAPLPEQQQRAVVTHEIGHVFGLNDRYDNNNCQNGETSIMEGVGCHAIHVPQGVDILRWTEFHVPTSSMAHYNDQFVGDNFNSFVRDYAAQGVASLHQLQYKNGSQWVLSPTYKFDWYKMADNWSWGLSDTHSGKWVTFSATWGPHGKNYRLCSRPIIGFNWSWALPPLYQVPGMTTGPWTCGQEVYRP